MSRFPSMTSRFGTPVRKIAAEPPPHGCRYITDKGPPWRNCGQPQAAGSPYCAVHHLRCYVHVRPSHDR